MAKERVIIRKDFDFDMGIEKYLAVFPDDPVATGTHLAYVAFYFNGNNKAVFEPYGEMDVSYYYKKTKIVHKKDPKARELLNTINSYFGVEFKLAEKI